MLSGEGSEKGHQTTVSSSTLKTLFLSYLQSTFSFIEMHSERRYKICICSAILGELESFRNCEECRIIFPNSVDAI